jgi:uncharacterized membrane protein YfcA
MSTPKEAAMPIVIGIAIGAAMGLLAGLIGVGGGIIAIPAMIYFLGLDVKIAMATSLAVIIPVSISGTVKHAMEGHVDYKTAIAIAIGGVAFAYLGAELHQRLEPQALKKLFAVFIICVGLKMLLEKPRKAEQLQDPQATATQPVKET